MRRMLRRLWLSIKLAVSLPPSVPPERVLPLRRFLINGVLTHASDHLVLTFVPLFALIQGASNLQLGALVAAASLLSALALPLGVRLASQVTPPRRQRFVLLGHGLARLTYLSIALLPWLVTPSQFLAALIGLWAARAFLLNLVQPTWTAFSTDLIPRSFRSAYLHNQKDAMTVAALLALPLTGLLIRLGGHSTGYPLGIGLAFLISLAGLIALARIPRTTPGNPAAPTVARVRPHLRYNRPFLIFCGIGFLWNFSLQIASPFLNIYLVRELGATALGVGVLAATGMLFGFLTSHIAADLVHVRGAWWMAHRISVIIPLVPWAWMLVTAAWQVTFLNALSGILWGAYNLAIFQMLMALTPEPVRPRAVILYQTLIFLSASLGPLVGGFLADRAGFDPVFFLSGAGRLLAAILLWALIREPRRDPVARPAT